MKIELIHDMIAKKLGENIPAEFKKLRTLERSIRDRYDRYVQSKVVLSKRELDNIEPYLGKKIFLPPELMDFVMHSKEVHKKRKIRNWILGILFFLFVAALSGISYILSEQIKVEVANLENTVKELIPKKQELDRKKEGFVTQTKELVQKEEEIKTKKEEIQKVEDQKKESDENLAKSKAESLRLQKEVETQKKDMDEKLKEISKVVEQIAESKRKAKIAMHKKVLEGKKWSEYLGKMKWEDAKKACANLSVPEPKKEGRVWRLPTIEEYKAVYEVDRKLVLKWREEACCGYWTGEEKSSSDRAYYFDIYDGSSDLSFKGSDFHVRCIF